MANAKRKCRYCKEYKRVEEGVVINNAFYCNHDHAYQYGIANKAKAQKVIEKENRRKKREFYESDIKTRREAAVREFNRYIRLRDSGGKCISCNKQLKHGYHAGHFIAAGSCTALRFDERNCFGQCVKCNNYLSGNRVQYRENLIKRFGQELVDFLEGPQPTIKITAEWYKEIEETYKAKCKQLEREAA